MVRKRVDLAAFRKQLKPGAQKFSSERIAQIARMDPAEKQRYLKKERRKK